MRLSLANNNNNNNNNKMHEMCMHVFMQSEYDVLKSPKSTTTNRNLKEEQNTENEVTSCKQLHSKIHACMHEICMQMFMSSENDILKSPESINMNRNMKQEQNTEN